jgi:hypothetical protein
MYIKFKGDLPQEAVTKFHVPSDLQVISATPFNVYPVPHTTVAPVTEPSEFKLIVPPPGGLKLSHVSERKEKTTVQFCNQHLNTHLHSLLPLKFEP